MPLIYPYSNPFAMDSLTTTTSFQLFSPTRDSPYVHKKSPGRNPQLRQYLPQRSHQTMDIPDFASLSHEADSPYFPFQPA
jgi:hypothetical protein